MASILGSQIRAAREAAGGGEGLSVRAAAEACGLAKSHLQRLEAGEVREPSPRVLRRLADGLGCSYSELLRAAGY